MSTEGEPVQHDKRDELIATITESVKTLDDLIDLIIGLEFHYDIRLTAVTRDDVEGEYQELWAIAGEKHPKMTEDEWEKFRSQWFWKKGHSEIMWDGVTDAICWDLWLAGLLPKEEVVE